MQLAGVRNVEAFVEYQKGQELFRMAHGGGGEFMEMMREGIVHFDRAIELVPDFAAAYWQKSDYYAHVLIESESSDNERTSALKELRKVLDSAYQLSAGSPRRLMIDFDRVLFSDDWTPLRNRIEKALAPTKCPDPTWIELATGIGFEEATLKMWRQYQRCEPLSLTAAQEIVFAAVRLGQYETALKEISEIEIKRGTSSWTSAARHWLLLTQGKFEEALAIAPDIIDDRTFVGMGAETLPLAMSGDIEGARAALEKWQAQYGRNIRGEIEMHAALGDREQANRLAKELDARPGGPMLLLLTAVNCACGAPFDLEATPNFRDRIKESGTTWPLKTLIKYPAKDW